LDYFIYNFAIIDAQYLDKIIKREVFCDYYV